MGLGYISARASKPGAEDQQMAKTNSAPKTKWIGETMACGTLRQRLFVDGAETPFFIDTAATIGHRTEGETHGLYGCGMGVEVRRKDGTTYRIAAILGSAARVSILKHRAEQMALGS
jgi:hypothetical protein